MRSHIVVVLFALCLVGRVWAAEPAAPLQLTVQAGTPVLLAEPMDLHGAAPDTPRYRVETTKLSLTFTNIGAEPLKLNTFAVENLRLGLSITGPDAASVSKQAVLWEMEMGPAQAADFPVLQPGQRWVCPLALSFPGQIGEYIYQLQQPGTYRARLTYTYTPPPARDGYVTDQNLVAGCFHGAVASNELTFTVLEVGDTVDGLQMALQSQPAADPLRTELPFTAYVRNVSKAAILICAWDLTPKGLHVFDDNGVEVQGSGDQRHFVPEDGILALPPGEKRGFTLAGHYEPTIVSVDEPQGTLVLSSHDGFGWRLPVRGVRTSVQAVLDMRSTTHTGERRDGQQLWSGRLTSQRLSVPLNLTAHRTALLKADLSDFGLRLFYAGVQEKPYYELHVHTGGAIGYQNPFVREVSITRAEASALIDALAKDGTLRDATTTEVAAAGTPVAGYSLHIDGNAKAQAHWVCELGWGMPLITRLDSLKEILPAEAKPAMEMLQGRLSGLRAQWLAEAAMEQPLTIMLPQGTVGSTLDALQATTDPGIHFSADDTTRKLPVYALAFGDIPLSDLVKCIGDSADCNVRIRDTDVRFQVWVR